MQKNSLAAHLVNLTNPMMMKGPVRELIPAPAQDLRIRVPDGHRVKSVRLLAAGNTPSYRQERNVLTLRVPSIRLHEVVAVDFA
jgi:hypothetical protein